MKFNFQKRAYKAYLLQWIGTNLGSVSAELRELGYDSFEIERGTIMARGKGMSLLCIHQDNWLRFGQNGSFKVMRPDEQETYVPIRSEDELRAENNKLRARINLCMKHIDAYQTAWDSKDLHKKLGNIQFDITFTEGMALVPIELTAENGAKSALIGEKFAGENVSWSAIKEIHKAVVKFFDVQKGGK